MTACPSYRMGRTVVCLRVAQLCSRVVQYLRVQGDKLLLSLIHFIHPVLHFLCLSLSLPHTISTLTTMSFHTHLYSLLSSTLLFSQPKPHCPSTSPSLSSSVTKPVHTVLTLRCCPLLTRLAPQHRTRPPPARLASLALSPGSLLETRLAPSGR